MSSPPFVQSGIASTLLSGESEPKVAARPIPALDTWVLADAVGTKAIASRAAVRAVEAFAEVLLKKPFREAETLREAVAKTNTALYEDESSLSRSVVFATSILAMRLSKGGLLLAHLGHARCYRFRAGGRVLLTRPHTALEELGATRHNSPFATHHRHLLTRALGISSEPNPEIIEDELRQGDLLVLVNDELCWAVEDREVAELFVHGASPSGIASSVAQLGDRARTEGTVVAVSIEREIAHPPEVQA